MSSFTLGVVPHLTQKQFLACPADEILFGGSLGGGKSFIAVIKAMILGCQHSGIHIGLFRRSVQDLRMTLLQEIYRWYPNALYKYSDKNRTVYLPNGSTITLNYVENDRDLENYKSVQFDVLIIDEAIDFTEYQLSWLKTTRVRSSKPGFRTRVYLLTNPIGVGRQALKKRYIDGKEPLKIYKTKETEMIPDEGVVIDGTLILPKRQIYIPSRLTDNPALMKNDPTYLFRLRELNQDDFIALLLGDWENQSGLFFKEWDENLHIIPDYVPGPSEALYMAMDWGTAKPTAVGFYAIDADRRCRMFDEIYTVKPNMPDEGMNYNAEEVGDLIANKLKKIHAQLGEIPKILVLDSQCWAKDGSFGFSIAEIIQAKLDVFKVLVIQAKKDRISGWQMVRKYLIPVGGVPFFQVSAKKCPHFIRTFPTMLHSKTVDSDIDDSMEDHHPDQLRYHLMSMPTPPHFATLRLVERDSEAWFDLQAAKRSFMS